MEDFEVFHGVNQPGKNNQEDKDKSIKTSNLKQRLQNLGLADIDIDHADQAGKERLVKLIKEYSDIFSKHALDCGEAKCFHHCIRLTDETFSPPLSQSPASRVPLARNCNNFCLKWRNRS